jgi:hypothetical protein
MTTSYMCRKLLRPYTKGKKPAFFIKLDISKAFDMINWLYLLSIMEHLGFGLK